MIRLSAIILAILALGCANLPVARVGDPVRLTLTNGAEVEGRLLGTSRDSVAVTGDADEQPAGRTVVARSTVEIAEVDDYAVRSWLRPVRCGLFATLVGLTSAAVAVDDTKDDTVAYGAALSAVSGINCFQTHDWRLATLPANALDAAATSGTPVDREDSEAGPR